MYKIQPKGGYSPMEKQIIENVRLLKKSKKDVENSNIQQIIDQVMPGCLHFVQDYFGSAYCISADGLILTCAHCVEDEEQKIIEFHYLIFSNGEIVKAKVLKSNSQLDTAILKIVERENEDNLPFPYVNIKEQSELPKKIEDIFCIGQPGYEDLETTSNKLTKTYYRPFHVSQGQIEGYMKDPVQVSKTELGPLKHSCWTYWGHSGAPIFDLNGYVIGMHNSWNDKNAMRHGMSLRSLQKFIQEYNSNNQLQN